MQTDFDLIKYLSNSFIASIIDLSSMCLPHFAKYAKFVDYDCCAIFTIQLYSTAPTVLMSIKFRFITSIWPKKTLKKRTVTFVCTYMSIFVSPVMPGAISTSQNTCKKNCQAIPFWQAKVFLNTKIAYISYEKKRGLNSICVMTCRTLYFRIFFNILIFCSIFWL